jgi:hypothetical protein
MRQLATIVVSAVAAFAFSCCAPTGPATAPHLGANAADQLAIAGNACGPTALLNAWRFGSPACQSIASSIPGKDDRSQLRHLIVHYGGQRSKHVPQRNRWSRRGINAVDLTDIANAMMQRQNIHPVTLVLPQGDRALKKTHQQWARSLRKGFPPVISLRRYEGTKVIDSHFVTVVRVPDRLDPNASFFTMDYLDPMGARLCQGRIHAPSAKQRTQLMAHTPATPVGQSRARGETSLVMDAMIVTP